MRENWKSIVAVMLLAPVLTELLTGNVPLTGFLNPLTFFFLATIGYGFPILLLREFAIRRGIGLLGMLPLGLCYGIINEGFLAKTFFLPHKVPIDAFDQYGFFGGVEVPWAITISTWHALFAFAFPILFAEALFPAGKGKSWLTKKAVLWIGIPVALLSVVIFSTHSGTSASGNLPHFVEIWAAFLILVGVSMVAPATPVLADGGEFRFRNVLAGAGALLAVLVFPSIFAGVKLPVVLFFAYFISLLLSGSLLLGGKRTIPRSSALSFALGAYLLQAALGLLIAIAMRSVLQIATEIVFLMVFSRCLYVVSRPADLAPRDGSPSLSA